MLYFTVNNFPGMLRYDIDITNFVKHVCVCARACVCVCTYEGLKVFDNACIILLICIFKFNTCIMTII